MEGVGLARHQRRAPARLAAFTLAACLAVVGPLVLVTPAARAAGVIILVNTAIDSEFPADTGCSLRAAIIAANTGSIAGYCTSGTGEPDSIRFSLGSGTPVINAFGPLPAITQNVTINGATGGATRVRITGNSTGDGLTVSGIGSTIRNLVVDDFQRGIVVTAANVTLRGNVVGPNGSIGISATGGATTIGGTTGVTPGGACTGDCNLIIRNEDVGLVLNDSGIVQGNVIGLPDSGSLPSGNGTGMVVTGGWIIGGSAAGAGNVISGNLGGGIAIFDACEGCLVQGNRIGTSKTGSPGTGNVSYGILLDKVGNVTIGGPDPGAGNLISGNGGNGITLGATVGVVIQGNGIGVTGTGSALGNGGAGIRTGGIGTSSLLVGSATIPGAGNTIAHNAGAGIQIEDLGGLAVIANEIRRNSIHSNGGAGIDLGPDVNGNIAAPVITGFAPVRGTACAGCAIDLYSDSQDEGRTFEGTVTANGAGEWSFPDLFGGANVTATATDADHETSEFSMPLVPVTPFTDIGGSTFAKDIAWLYANGITVGCSATKYCPTDPVSREQMASFLSRMFRLQATATDFFTDDEESSHEVNINRLAAAEITTGCSQTTFCPRALVLRDQMASFLARATDLTVGTGRDYFNDDDGNTHELNIDRNAAAGLTTGCAPFTYCPSSSVTREQMAAFLHRILVPVAPPPFPAP